MQSLLSDIEPRNQNYCYDAGIPPFCSIDLQVISFLSSSGLWLHNQVCYFFTLLKISVYDQNGEKEADFSSLLWRWNSSLFQYCSASHKVFKLIRLMLTLSSLPFFELLKIAQYDQTTVVLSDHWLEMQLEGFETPEESSIENEIFTPSPKEFKMSVTGWYLVIWQEDRSELQRYLAF